MEDRLANEIQRCQMSSNEGDTAPPDRQILFDYSLHQQKLEQVQSAKYLGITITDNLDWGQHISEISSKATYRVWMGMPADLKSVKIEVKNQ